MESKNKKGYVTDFILIFKNRNTKSTNQINWIWASLLVQILKRANKTKN
jgi:hypothetical protein